MPTEYSYITDVIKDFTIKMLQEIMRSYPGYGWLPDAQHTAVDILDAYSQDQANPAMKPSIIIERGPIEFMDVSVMPYTNRNILSNTQSGQLILKGAMNIRVVTNDGLLSERMAAFIFQALLTLKFWTTKQGSIRVDPISLGGEIPLNPTSELQYISTPITLSLSFALGWATQPLNNQIISKLTITSESDVPFTMIITPA